MNDNSKIITIIQDVVKYIHDKDIQTSTQFRAEYPAGASRVVSYGLTWANDIQPAYKAKYGEYIGGKTVPKWTTLSDEQLINVIGDIFDEYHFNAWSDYVNWYTKQPTLIKKQYPSPATITKKLGYGAKGVESVLSEKLGRPIDKSLRGKVNV